jgi:hypothetical protein
MPAKLSYWIKERFNPQFDKPYYSKGGQLTKAAAKKKENTIYGDNEYKTLEAYEAAIFQFIADGFRVL